MSKGRYAVFILVCDVWYQIDHFDYSVFAYWWILMKIVNDQNVKVIYVFIKILHNDANTC